MKKLTIMTLTLAMLLGLVACGDKTETSTSPNAKDSITEKVEAKAEEVFGTELVFKDDDAQETDIKFKTSVPVTEKGYYITCSTFNESELPYTRKQMYLAVASSEKKDLVLYTPEGAYYGQYYTTSAYFNYAVIVNEDGENKMYRISFDVNGTDEYKDEYAEDFLQIVKDFLAAGYGDVSTMSDVSFEKDFEISKNVWGRFTSPDAITAAEFAEL